MKVLVATDKAQGMRANDFNWTLPGELVQFPYIECSREAVDGRCGCKRSMAGLDSLKSTTTFAVQDRELTRDQYIVLLDGADRRGGWNSSIARIATTADELLRVANLFPVGAVLERRGRRVQLRWKPE